MQGRTTPVVVHHQLRRRLPAPEIRDDCPRQLSLHVHHPQLSTHQPSYAFCHPGSTCRPHQPRNHHSHSTIDQHRRQRHQHDAEQRAVQRILVEIQQHQRPREQLRAHRHRQQLQRPKQTVAVQTEQHEAPAGIAPLYERLITKQDTGHRQTRQLGTDIKEVHRAHQQHQQHRGQQHIGTLPPPMHTGQQHQQRGHQRRPHQRRRQASHESIAPDEGHDKQ